MMFEKFDFISIGLKNENQFKIEALTSTEVSFLETPFRIMLVVA